MKQVQKGFTLIELMIVVAIIGILAAVAIPAYSDYIVKSKLSKVAGVVDPIKLAIAMYWQENGSFVSVAGPTGVGSAGWTSLGLTTAATTTTEVPEVTMLACAAPCDGTSAAASNQIGVKLGGIKATVIDGTYITFIPTTGATAMTWSNVCTSTDAIVKKYFAC